MLSTKSAPSSFSFAPFAALRDKSHYGEIHRFPEQYRGRADSPGGAGHEQHRTLSRRRRRLAPLGQGLPGGEEDQRSTSHLFQ